MPTTDKLLCDKRGSTGYITFNNPARHNAMSIEMYRALPEVLSTLEDDHEVRVIVLTGAGGKSFISGADISEFGDEDEDANEDAYESVPRLARARKPTVAMIRGYCIGGGLEIALACDLRIASCESRFAIPAAKLGLGYPASGIKKLITLVGPGVAKDIFFTGRLLSADEALGANLVNRVVADEALEDTVGDYCKRIAANAPLTIDAVKRIIAELEQAEPDEALCETLYRRCFESADYKEGWTAFLEKRPPEFTGR